MSEQKAKIRKCPDIIYPFGRKQNKNIDKSFVKDLGIEILLEQIQFSRESIIQSGAKETASSVLTNLNQDIDTADYREDVFFDIIPYAKLKTELNDTVTRLLYLKKDYQMTVHGILSQDIQMLGSYKEFVKGGLNFENAKSGALKKTESYFSQIRDSFEFKDLETTLDEIRKINQVKLGVGLDENFSVKKIDILGFEDKENIEDKDTEPSFFSSSRFDQNASTARDYLSNMISIHIRQKYGNIIEFNKVQIQEILGLLPQLDFYKSIADYYISYQRKDFDICRPMLLPKEKRKMLIENGINPLIKEAQKKASDVVPNNIKYDAEENIFFITGPNSGGKSTFVEMAGQMQTSAQNGLPIFAKNAEVSFVDGIYTHFSIPFDPRTGVGGYETDLLRTKEIFERATPWSMVIVDEPCKGTSYEEGCKKMLDIIEGYQILGCATFITSHMHDAAIQLEKENKKFKAVRNLSVDCIIDEKGDITNYTYKIKPGLAIKSYGAETARKVGLGKDDIRKIILDKAEACGYEKLLRK